MKKTISIIMIILLWMSFIGQENIVDDFSLAATYGSLKFIIWTISLTIVPALFVLINNKKIEDKKGTEICIKNSIIVLILSILFDILILGGIYDEVFENAGAAIIYVVSFYYINKTFFVSSKENKEAKEKIVINEVQKDKEENKTDYIEEKSSEKNKENLANDLINLEDKTKIALIIVSIIATILLIVSICFFNQNIKLKNKYDSLERTNKRNESYIKDLEKINNSYEEKVEFLDENIVFVLDGYGNYYYTYDQVQKVTQGEEYSYWAYTDVEAKAKGYKAWKK